MGIVKESWNDWKTSSTIWQFDVGKESKRGAHGLESLQKIKYFKDRREVYKNAKFPGKLVPQLVEKLINKYSEKGDLVLAPFAGSGTVIIEASLLGRKSIGIDINPGAIELIKKKLKEKSLESFRKDAKKYIPKIIHGRAQDELKNIKNNSIDLILAHPPYWNLIKYTDEVGDLSRMPLEEFKKTMKKIFFEMHRVLKKDKYCILVIGDRRKSGIIPLGFYMTEIGIASGFNLWDIMIYHTNFKGKQYNRYQQLMSKRYQFHLQNHDYILIFKK
jgi:DNA modification methylase